MENLRQSLAAILCLSLSAPASSFAQATPRPVTSKQAKQAAQPRAGKAHASAPLSGDLRILHALNRFTFGPRPGDLEAVKNVGGGNRGLDKWFNQQLHPGSLDNSALDARLTQFPAMRFNTPDLLDRLPSNAMIRQASEGKVPIPAAGPLHAVYENEIARYEMRQQKKAEQKEQPAALIVPTVMQGSTHDNASGLVPREAATMSKIGSGASRAPTDGSMPQPEVARVLALAPSQRVDHLAHLSQTDFDSFRKGLKGPQRQTLNADLDPSQRELVAALEAPQRVVIDELAAQRLTRDIYSSVQLQEVMTDFWLNHFNVYLRKNDETPYYLVSYERDVIRPHALGRFEDLLEATAHSPAMLLYLDNSSSTGPDSPATEKARLNAARHPEAKKQAPQGLNENYARELMELHTLGVNGGYTQADVTQVARVLTGWTVERPQRGGGFMFDATRHEPGAKKVMGKTIKVDGEQEGRELLHLLATRPATAKFIARKLAIRFVSDEPPQALVDRMAKSYLSSGGDIPTVLTTLFHSPEFWAADDYRAKVKTPLEFVVSAARATDMNLDNLQPLANALRDMGMPLYGAVAPTGYNWQSSTWVSTAALVNRMNFALSLAANKLPGISIFWGPRPAAVVTQLSDTASPTLVRRPVNSSLNAIAAPEAEEHRLEPLLVAGGISISTRSALLAQFDSQGQTQSAPSDTAVKPAPTTARPVNANQLAASLEKQDQLLAGLLLGSPEFQRR